jgi:hypothetical protein
MTAKLHVTVSSNCDEINARVVRDGKPVPGAKVLLLLGGSVKQPYDLMADYANEEGESRFLGLSPGQYRLWAWQVDSFGSFVGPATLDGAEERSAVAQVGRGQHVRLDVPLMPQEGGFK